MRLTKNQESGLRVAINRYKNGERFTIISGYAGTGKSTLVKFLVEALSTCGIDPQKDICYTAFTGKACQVLQSKGHKNVSTLHRLLYTHRPLGNGKYIRKKNETIDYKIVIVDEISMAPTDILQDLFSHNVHIIGLGDPLQLPPVNPDDNNHLLDNPHIFLDEIMRQAAESEIIRLSMKIRNGESINPAEFSKEVKIFPREALSTGMLQWADQNICATNATRIQINNTMRDLMGRGNNPEAGDKVICLRNYWDIISDNENPLINGTIGFLQTPLYAGTDWVPHFLSSNKQSLRIENISANILTETGELFSHLKCDKKLLLTGEKSLDAQTEFKLLRNAKFSHIPSMEFTYGYAITAWKAQGSSWNKVLVLEEKFPFDKETHQKALYTAITRAEERLVLIRQ